MRLLSMPSQSTIVDSSPKVRALLAVFHQKAHRYCEQATGLRTSDSWLTEWFDVQKASRIAVVERKHTWKVCDRAKRRYLRRTFAVKRQVELASKPYSLVSMLLAWTLGMRPRAPVNAEICSTVPLTMRAMTFLPLSWSGMPIRPQMIDPWFVSADCTCGTELLSLTTIATTPVLFMVVLLWEK